MEEIVKINVYKKCLISQDNIILEVDRDFLDLIGYMKIELLGKTLVDTGEILGIDSQVDLQDIKDNTTIFIFTKELVAIEGTISCEIIDDGTKKVFSFKVDLLQSVNQSFDLANQLGTNRGDGVAIFSFPKLVLINTNQNHLNHFEPPYNKRINSIGKNIMEILGEQLYNLFDKIKDYVINTGNPFYGEQMRDNSSVLVERYWDVSLVPILKNEKIKYLILYLSNETEKDSNKDAIMQKNKELETIIKDMSDEIIIFDKDFNIDIFNKKVEESISIYKPILKDNNNTDNIQKYNFVFDENDFMFDEDNQLIPYKNLPSQRIAKGEFISSFFMKIVNVSGIKCREVYGYPTYDKDGNFSHGVMILRDVNDRIQKEEARLIKTQKELLSKVVESLDLEYILCTYPDLKIISINGNGLNSLKEINTGTKSWVSPIGESYFAIYNIDEETTRKELELYLIKEKDHSYISHRNYIVNGEQRFFKTINQPIFGLNNKIVEIIFITINITDEVKAKNKIEDDLDMQNQMFSTISHELKTPLSIIFSASQLIEMYLEKNINKINKKDISENIDIIKQNCYRFTKLINNIIDLSIMESGFYKLHYRNKNIVGIIEDIIDSVRIYVKNKGLSIIFDTDIEEKIMAIDVEKMERIILNLISNAVKFSPKGENIYIDIKDKGDFIEILVGDSGVGISTNHLSTIFNKYKKVDNSLVRNAEGSGIGLALVKTMVDLLGGEISVESELGKGSVFRVKLPVKILDESENTKSIKDSGNIMEQINIEFSDIYDK